MFRITSSAGQRHEPPRRSLRWIAVLLASVVLHVLVFEWANGRIALPSVRDEQPAVIMTELRPAPAEPPPAVAAAPKRKPKPRRPATPPVAQPAAPEPVVETNTADAGMDPVAEVASAEPPAAAEQAPAAAETAGPPTYKFDPPPSVKLNYEVQALREGKQWYGKGSFHWNAAGGRYNVIGEASVTFLFKITVLNFRSEGLIGDAGIAPVLYSEKPWHKPETNTHFQHERQKISFSASEATYPYNGGEQDRATIMWQLAGIGRGDPSQFAPGAAMNIVVAGARKAETWNIQIVGLEEIDTGSGNMTAWHVARLPVAGSYDQRIDFWLAPQHEWYPVKLRFTYANGDYLDMSLSEFKKTTAQ